MLQNRASKLQWSVYNIVVLYGLMQNDIAQCGQSSSEHALHNGNFCKCNPKWQLLCAYIFLAIRPYYTGL